jgi:hypothetical protein
MSESQTTSANAEAHAYMRSAHNLCLRWFRAQYRPFNESPVLQGFYDRIAARGTPAGDEFPKWA